MEGKRLTLSFGRSGVSANISLTTLSESRGQHGRPNVLHIQHIVTQRILFDTTTHFVSENRVVFRCLGSPVISWTISQIT